MLELRDAFKRYATGDVQGGKSDGRVDPVAVLEDIALDDTAPHAARVSAAKAPLERGRPPTAADKPGQPKLVWIKKDATNG
ncbi:MAG: hypothetical protein ACR652_02640 [Methylocystis sp.]|uniref:hypothetical protein n=1 Tax=Methylocystis sp. TaxID=1911079 RepID=UPI003DA4B074